MSFEYLSIVKSDLRIVSSLRPWDFACFKEKS